jgi:hypothetical protein
MNLLVTTKRAGPYLAALSAIGLCLSATAADNPETGKQGETLAGETKPLERAYSKGTRLVSRLDLGSGRGNLIMAWSGRCAYVASGMGLSADGSLKPDTRGPTSGVAVIDVRKPDAPKLVRYLQDKGAIDATETMHAATTRRRAVLAASTYGGVPGINGPKEGWLNLYDVSDCANPKLTAEVKWPEPAHTVTVSPNGKRVYGTILNPFTGDGGIQVMDISDMKNPRFIGKFGATRPDGTSFPFAPHEISISPDEKRIYAGTISSKGGDLNKGIKLFPPSAEGLGQDAGGIYIFDNSDLATGKADPRLQLVGTALHGGWHSAVQARIGGKPYLVGAGELGACPGAWPRLSDISDEKNPRIVGEFRLAMNVRENCPPRTAIEQATGGIVGAPGTATAHFNDVDNATNTKFGLFPMLWAGIRIADLRDPANPEEIAYFKPGDPCGSHVRYEPKSGHIWFACMTSGFYVIELDKALKR